MRTFLVFGLSIVLLIGCKEERNRNKENIASADAAIPSIVPEMRFGLDLNKYDVVEKKISWGDTFETILKKTGIDYPQIYSIREAVKETFDVHHLKAGKKYSLFYCKDSVTMPKYFVYHPSVEGYTLIQLKDSLHVEKRVKETRTVELQAAGVITHSLYQTMMDNGFNEALTFRLSDIYAWTIDFFKLQEGDRFKVIYTEKFVDDSISIGIPRIKAVYFEHNGVGQYAFEFESDPKRGIIDYFDENAKYLRRAFLKGPLKFNRISSRYNLRRRIAYYGYRVRPHRGTDFAARVGTPIMTTANGTVVKSGYTRGNGNYVMVRHNNVYTTQYLHMKKRKVKVGDYVKQGEVIGWVGMTGNTSGPHVCYRFWKNGKLVDPYKQKLPEAKPISAELKATFLTYIIPIKEQLDCINFEGVQFSEDMAALNSDLKENDPS